MFIFKIESKYFNLNFSISVTLPKFRKKPKNADIHPSQEDINIFDEETDDIIVEDENDEISEMARKFEEELKENELYEIPYSDMPQRPNISDDVEIITDEYEKEYEDVIMGRR